MTYAENRHERMKLRADAPGVFPALRYYERAEKSLRVWPPLREVLSMYSAKAMRVP